PTPQAEATMRWAAIHAPTRSLRVTAEMALGTMARNLSNSAPARAAGIVDELLRKLRAARTEEEIRLQLMALGNAGSIRARLALLSNLGRAQDAFPNVRQLIQRTAAHDASPNIRKAAASLEPQPDGRCGTAPK